MSSNTAIDATKRIQGLVAQILNERELVINIGAEAGVKPKMKFAVLSPQALEIKDPTTHEVLDTVDREKIRVEARDVRPKVTICRTYRTRSNGGIDVRLLFLPSEVAENLRADKSSFPPALTDEESYVKITDRVVQVDEE